MNNDDSIHNSIHHGDNTLDQYLKVKAAIKPLDDALAEILTPEQQWALDHHFGNLVRYVLSTPRH